MTAEHDQSLPDWARQERQNDRDWIADNLHVFWPMAMGANTEHGRGMLVVDTLVRVDGKGHPIAYFPESAVAELDDEDAKRMVREYDAEQEFVVFSLNRKGGQAHTGSGQCPAVCQNFTRLFFLPPVLVIAIVQLYLWQRLHLNRMDGR